MGAVAGNRNSPDDAVVPSGAPKSGAEVVGDPDDVDCMGVTTVNGDGVRDFDDGEVRAIGGAGPVGVLES